ncbi:hypothetical protein GOP47_0027359 [Adiantum capillus-veneris]|nr:hypothetical protein GOP47_0027359 [Adiantum capillus-veneris]
MKAILPFRMQSCGAGLGGKGPNRRTDEDFDKERLLLYNNNSARMGDPAGHEGEAGVCSPRLRERVDSD